MTSTMVTVTYIAILRALLGGQTTHGQMMVMPGHMSPFANSMAFNQMAHNGRLNNFMGVHGSNSNYQQRPREATIFTAIGYDKLDDGSQMRVTFREKSASFPSSPYSGSWDTPLDWYIHGTFLNSDVLDKTGTYYLVITETGRTRDGCDPASLGRVIGSNRMSQRPVGVLPDRLLMTSSGPTVFASKLSGVSRGQIAGAGIAACQFVNNGYCSGAIQFCGTITKDNLSAMEVPIPASAGGGSPGEPHFASALLNNRMEKQVDELFNFGTTNDANALLNGANNDFPLF